MHTLKEYQAIAERNIQENPHRDEPISLYEPIHYTMEAGGKRLRPAMALMACEMACGDYRPALNIAHALEMFHNFTLLHDDIMDKSDMRRGQPTVHKKWDNNTAILSGDAMVMLAYELLSRTESPNLSRMVRRFTQAGLNVCRGQQYDMDFEQAPAISLPQYMEMIRLKTAELLSVSLELGAMAGGAPDAMLAQLHSYGTQLGLAFQLQDDYLDSFGDEGTFGKATGSDIVNNKKTWLLISALEQATGQQKDKLLQSIEMPIRKREEKTQTVLGIYRELGLDRQINERIGQHLALAKEAIRQTGGPTETALELLAKLENRKK